MYMDSLIVLVKQCPSLPATLKLSMVVQLPVGVLVVMYGGRIP